MKHIQIKDTFLNQELSKREMLTLYIDFSQIQYAFSTYSNQGFGFLDEMAFFGNICSQANNLCVQANYPVGPSVVEIPSLVTPDTKISTSKKIHKLSILHA